MKDKINMAKIALDLAEKSPNLTPGQYKETLLIFIELAKIEKITNDWLRRVGKWIKK